MHAANVRASVYMMLAMAGFTLNDAFIKSIDGAIGLGQILLVRGTVATLLLFALYRYFSRSDRVQGGATAAVPGRSANSFSIVRRLIKRDQQLWHPLMLWRGLFDVAATMAFLTALSHVPLADLSALLQALPLAVTLGAVLFLRERVGWRRWAAILIGFVGVLIVLRPGLGGISVYSLLGLLAVVFAAARDLVTRRLPDHIPSLLVSMVTSLLITVSGLLLMLLSGGWTEMNRELWFTLAGAAIFIIGGYQFIVLAMRHGEISYVAPFRYTSLVWAIVLGFVWFGEVPGVSMMLGSALIVLTGLYAFRREQRLTESAN